MTELDALRDKIDGIDKKIVRLLEERMKISHKIGLYKASCGMPVLDMEREADVIRSRQDMLDNREYAEAVRALYELIMRFSRENQEDRQ